MRKELLDMFGEYDRVAKRIKAIPATPGSSQDRVQKAIVTRASLFLQQHMLPLKVGCSHGNSSQADSGTVVEARRNRPEPENVISDVLDPKRLD